VHSQIGPDHDDKTLKQQKTTSMDPSMMKSNHKHLEYVRQLDKTALKNCMELALLRHEKELSVKQ